VNDGFDVLAASNLSMIARAHDRRTAGHGKAVIYSVESNCYPLPALYGPPGEQLCDRFRPKLYLNAGGFMGTRSAIVDHLTAVAACAVAPDRLMDDQVCAQLSFLQTEAPELFGQTKAERQHWRREWRRGSSVPWSYDPQPLVLLDEDSTIWQTAMHHPACLEGVHPRRLTPPRKRTSRGSPAPLMWHFNGPCKIGFRRTVGHSKMARYPIQTHPSASSGLDPLLDRIWSKPALLPHLASASASNAPLASAGAVKALQAPTTALQASPTSGWTQAAVRVYRGGADGVLSATEYPVAQFCPQATAADVGDARGAGGDAAGGEEAGGKGSSSAAGRDEL